MQFFFLINMKTLLIGDDTNALAILLCAQTQEQQQQIERNQSNWVRKRTWEQFQWFIYGFTILAANHTQHNSYWKQQLNVVQTNSVGNTSTMHELMNAAFVDCKGFKRKVQETTICFLFVFNNYGSMIFHFSKYQLFSFRRVIKWSNWDS